MPGLRSLRNRLAVVFGLIVLGAIATIYLSVTPRLEERLRNEKQEALAQDARRYARGLAEQMVDDPRSNTRLDGLVNRAAAQVSAELLVVQPLGGDSPAAVDGIVESSSEGVRFPDVYPIAVDTVRARRVLSRIEPTGVGRQAFASVPLVADDRVVGVAVFADTLSDVDDSVAVIRRQILVSGAVALAIALLAGYLVARALSARVNRLERAARRVAAGDFSNPIRADSSDELGRLAAAFDDMQHQLARLDRARKQFIASASHELRTPIFSLGGFLELLADEDLDEETRRQFLEQLRGQVDRMRTLATELLDLSRLESGALELRTEPTDVGELAREVAAEFTPAAQRHGSDVALDLDPDPIELDCDPERVAQVLRILLDNALVHTPEGTGVRVSAERRNGQVRLEVSDAGHGIRRQNMPHIFEPFFTSNEHTQGAGLGLAIARELAERMQGRLEVRSTPGDTTFSLELPA